MARPGSKDSQDTVDYRLKIPEEKKQDAQDALATYISECPAAQSVIGCIDIQHQLNIE
jgi:hypothetical protein